jgi:hypothetical protein
MIFSENPFPRCANVALPVRIMPQRKNPAIVKLLETATGPPESGLFRGLADGT